MAWIALAYAIAGAVAAAMVLRLGGRPSWLVILAADVAATVAVFGASVLFDNSSVYDAYWSIAPIAIAAGLLAVSAAHGGPTVRALTVTLLVTAWGARLTWNWARGWSGMAHEDWRYVRLREQTGRAYWLVSLLGLSGRFSRRSLSPWRIRDRPSCFTQALRARATCATPGRIGAPSKWPSKQRLRSDTLKYEEPSDAASGAGIGWNPAYGNGVNAGV